MSTVQKILDELHLSRVQLESDKKAGEKARAEYEEFDKKIKILREQHELSKQKLTEVYKSIAVRTIDVNLYIRKLEIVKLKIGELKSNISHLAHQLTNLREEHSRNSEWLLQNSIKFANLWNCTEHGYEQRKLHQQNSMMEMNAKKAQLLHDLDGFMTMKKNIEDSQTELLSLEKKYQQHEEIMDGKEKELFKEMDKVGEILTTMLKKKEEIEQQRHAELDKILFQIERKKDTVSKLQLRATKFRSIVDSQRNPPQSYWSVSNKSDTNGTPLTPATQDTRKEQINCSRIYQPNKPTPPIQQSAGFFHVVPKNGEESKISESQYTDEGISNQKMNSAKAPARIFHFKKKPAVPNTSHNTDFVSGRTMYQSKYGQ